MKKNLFILKVILLVCLSNSMNAQGPNAPEAGAFEPVDVPDMVNLYTGDLTYVLPLLNIPSPEGGYPLSLSYHAGIGMDQEASWVGLGWNVNPGSILRGVNGFPDDWASTKIINRYYDAGGSNTTTTVSASYTNLSGMTIAGSVSYNSNKGWGGSVSSGFGIALNGGNLGITETYGIRPGGELYGSIEAGFKSDSGFSVGGSIGTEGVGIGAGFAGGSVGYGRSWGGNDQLSIGLDQGFWATGITLSSGGVSSSLQVGGIGINNSSTSTVTEGDYTVKTKSSSIGINVITPVGAFSVGYNKQSVKWALNSKKENFISGGLYLNEARKYRCQISYYTYRDDGYEIIRYKEYDSKYVSNSWECSCQAFDLPQDAEDCWETIVVGPDVSSNFFMDMYEIGVENKIKSNSANNGVFPAYDSFSVTAQGISGSMTPFLFQAGSLNGIGGTEFRDLEGDYSLTYTFPESTDWQYQQTEFNRQINFEFNNEGGSSLFVAPVSFTNNAQAKTPFDYLVNSNSNIHPRQKRGHYVNYFTNDDLLKVNIQGLMLPEELNIPADCDESIGAYTITTPDGKTYHYALPVYNHETLNRTLDVIDKPERESYFETQQLKPYATHWLLTAVTGPDFVDLNNNRRVDEGDYGYWVDFQYGRWSDAFSWKTPYGKASEYDNLSETRNIVRGRKQLYYLDRIKTRTHTAIFVKNVREDSRSENWHHREVEYAAFPNPSTFDSPQFTINSHRSLRLDKIILIKNSLDVVNKKIGSGLAAETYVDIVYRDGKNERAYYNSEDNVIDVKDNYQDVISSAVKVIDFGRHYSYDLAPGSPNSTKGRLTLNGLSFMGRGGKMVIPPYKFYYGYARQFDVNQIDDWGYYKGSPATWSLNRIINPVGGEMAIVYEPDDYSRVAIENGKPFLQGLKFTFITEPPRGSDWRTAPVGITRIKIEVDEKDPTVNGLKLSDHFDPTKPFFMDMWYSAVYNHSGAGYDRSAVNIDGQMATIVQLNTTYNYMIVDVKASSPSFRDVFQHSAEPVSVKNASNHYAGIENLELPRYQLAYTGEPDHRKYSMVHHILGNKVQNVLTGVRVKAITLKGTGIKPITTIYDYKKPNSTFSSGVISYYPHKENSTVAIPYASELPPPIATYEHVSVKKVPGENLNSTDFLLKTDYQFEVLKSKEPNLIKFGDLFEIQTSKTFGVVNSTTGMEVEAKNLVIKDNLNRLGQLLSVKTYNNENQLLNETRHSFVPKEQVNHGVTQESFQTYKVVNYHDNSNVNYVDQSRDKWLLNSSSRITYPVILNSTSTTAGGYTISTSPISFDPVTGQVLATVSETSTGLQVKSVMVPAYTKYLGMGSKVENILNSNMLIQPAAQLTEIYISDQWKTIAAGITTWNNNWTYYNYLGQKSTPVASNHLIWRKHKSFLWNGSINAVDGTYENYIGDFDSFNWSIGGTQSNSKWINTATTTYYDHFSYPVEQQDINGNYSSSKMGDAETKIISVSNSAFNSQFYSGAEDLITGTQYFGGQVFKGSTAIWAKVPHTGLRSIQVAANVKAFAVKPLAGKYRASVWALKRTGYNYLGTRIKVGTSVINFNSNETVMAGDWVQLNFDLPNVLAGQEIFLSNISATAIYDDFRVYPSSASIISYVYNEWDQPSSILGGNNMGSTYEYDTEGRQKKVFMEVMDETGKPGGFKLAKELKYNYKATAQLDSNGNGEIDLVETYQPLQLFIRAGDLQAYSTTITAVASGGSGNYSYRWATGDYQNSLTYGSWTSSSEIPITNPCPDGVKYYKCQVRDNETQLLVERSSWLSRSCDGGPIIEPQPEPIVQ